MTVSITPHKLSGTIEAIPSKSYAQRILLASALANDVTKIKIRSMSNDILAAIKCINALGANVKSENGIITVTPNTTAPKCNEIFECNESGTVLRLTLPVACAVYDNSVFKGSGRLLQRPLSPLKEELEKKGCKITQTDNSTLKLCGKITNGIYTLPGNVSSQFISGLLFALPLLEGDSKIIITSELQSRGYVDMTIDVLKTFGISVWQSGNTYTVKGSQKYISPEIITVEGDWSNSAFWLCAGALNGNITVTGLNTDSKQGDRAVLDILSAMGANIIQSDEKISVYTQKNLIPTDVDLSQIPDLAPVLAAVASYAEGETLFFNAQRLRLKESDRINTVCDMLKAIGCNATSGDDYIKINGKNYISGGIADSHNDHRISMALAVCATVSKNNIIITNAEAVTKTYPDFFNDYTKLGGIVDVIDN